MHLSLTKDRLAGYVCHQLNAIFPDGDDVATGDLLVAVEGALQRIEYCFRRTCVPSYFREGVARFSHLYGDQYLMFLWMLSNELWRREAPRGLLDKIYLLNKYLHGFDCMYNNPLPAIFIVVHGLGTVLGKATYGDFLTVYHGCSVGRSGDSYAVLGRGVGIGVGASVLGQCTVGDFGSVGAGCTLINTSVPEGQSIYRDNDGRLVCSQGPRGAIARRCFADEYLFPS